MVHYAGMTSNQNTAVADRTPATRKAYKQLGQHIADAINAKSVHPHIGTWMGRPGVSVELRMTNKADGRRVIIHKWDDEDTCSVRYITGDFWRGDPAKREEFAKDESIAFTVADIANAAAQMVA